MPRRSSNDLQPPKSKKIKKGHVGEEDTPLRSTFTVSELWQKKMHFDLLNETFGYLDLRNSKKFARVSTSWKSMLSSTTVMYKGILFVDWRTSSGTQVRIEAALARVESWPNLSALQTIKHFVSIGLASNVDRTNGPDYADMVNRFHAYVTKLALPSSLSSLTFCGDTAIDGDVLEVVSAFVKQSVAVRLINCRLKAPYGDFLMNGSGYDNASWGNRGLTYMIWDLVILVPQLVFDDSFKGIEDKYKQLMWLFKQYDQQNLVWPYAEDQREWLKESLLLATPNNNLHTSRHGSCNCEIQWGWNIRCKTCWCSCKMRQLGLKYVFHAYSMWRRYLYFTPDEAEGVRSELKRMGIHTDVAEEGQELDTLDCAFLGRLMVWMNKNNKKKMGNFKPPPHPFPKDLDAGFWSLY